MGSDGRATIFALSTAAGRAGIAVLRVSGPATRDAAAALTARPLPRPRTATLRSFLDDEGLAIDRGLLLWFPAPASFTGEDLAEFHVHGGRAIVDAMLGALGRVSGLRPAEPGEFTRRAVENGKFDLTAAEGLTDLIGAETEAQRRQALRQYDGALAALYEGWRHRLIAILALVEAAIDFSDEELPDDVLEQARDALHEIAAEIARHIDDGGRGEILREGLRIALIGPPNAGKSSLLNALARRDVAIVSDIAGTTRDVIDVKLDLGGFPVIVSDTAGLRASEDKVEAEGVRRALAQAQASDLVLLLVDGSEDVVPELPEGVKPPLIVWNKSDLVPHVARRPGINVSARTGEGIDALVAALTQAVRSIADVPREAPLLTRARHRILLMEASACLARALKAPAERPELLGEDVRLALRALGRITGRVDVEEILDAIFAGFCIGK